MDGCHLCWRKTWHFRLARQGGCERSAIRFHQHQSGTPFVLVRAPRQFCESFSRKYFCRTRSAHESPMRRHSSLSLKRLGYPLSAFFSSMMFLRTSKSREPGLQPIHVTTRSNVPDTCPHGCMGFRSDWHTRPTVDRRGPCPTPGDGCLLSRRAVAGRRGAST
jgi:hypothetical protein